MESLARQSISGLRGLIFGKGFVSACWIAVLRSQRRGGVLAVTVQRFLSVQMFLILFLLIFLVKN